MKTVFVLLLIILILGLGVFFVSLRNTSSIEPTVYTKDDLIVVTIPKENQKIASPLVVEGMARGYWFFEASFPVKVVDEKGALLGVVPAQALGEWMTEDFVPFRAELIFEKPTTQKGFLILEKDNPSGLPEHADDLRIPIEFDMSLQATRQIFLYYYNPEKDKDENNNILCSAKGLEEVRRFIPLTKTPIQDTITLLLKGNLTQEERARGITTEFPLPGFSLKEAAFRDGKLVLGFNDLERATVGGACRIGVLWAQIEATAKQFPEVKEVRFAPGDLFQP